MDARTRSAAVQSSFTLVGAVACLAFLGLQLRQILEPQTTNRSDLVPIASLKLESNVVERKFFKEVLWNSLPDSKQLYLKDAIRTGPSSSAVIRFDDGTELSLLENSLVVLDRDDGKIQVNFQKGSVSAKTGDSKSGLTIRTEGGLIRVENSSGAGGSIDLRGEGKGVEVALEGVRAEVETRSGTQTLDPSQLGSLTSDGGLQSRSVQVDLMYPVAGTRFVRDGVRAEVGFLWKEKTTRSLGTRIQIAKDAEFNVVLFERPAKAQFRESLPDGNYYWRIIERGLSKEVQILSRVFHFSVIRVEPPVLLLPEDQAQVSYLKAIPTVELQWRHSLSGEVLHDVELSKDPSFSKIENLGSVRTEREGDGFVRSVVRWVEPKEGDWFWRIRSRVEKTGLRGTETVERLSKVRTFRFLKADRLEAPILVEPFHKRSVAIKTDEEPILFRWNPVPEARSYEIEVSERSDFSRTITRFESPLTEWKTAIRVQGRLFWRVRSRLEAKNSEAQSDFSRPSAFFLSRSGGLRLLSPQSSAVLLLSRGSTSVPFKWEPFVGAKEYRLEFSTRSDFRDSIKEINSEETTIELKDLDQEGTYYWRIYALGKDDKIIALSEPSSLTLRRPPPPDVVEKTEPAQSAVIQMPPIQSVDFKWKAVARAKNYEFRIERVETNGKVSSLVLRRKRSLGDTEKLTVGRYRWNVRAIDEDLRAGEWGPEREVEVKLEGVLEAPNLVAPLPGALIERSVPEPIRFEWNAVPGAKAYRFSINGEVIQESIRATSFDYRIPRSGRVMWQVEAVASDGKVGLPVKGDVTVKWRSLLSAPKKIKVQFTEDSP